MISIQELESTEEFSIVAPLRGYYKYETPKVIEEFEDQEFARTHIEAVLYQRMSADRKNTFDPDKHSWNVGHYIRKLEADGVIEKTGGRTLGMQCLYRRVV